MAPWQPREVFEDGAGAHGLPACLLTLTVLAHPGTQRGWESLVTEGFLAPCAQVRASCPLLWCPLQVPQSGTRASPASPLTWPRPLFTGV